MHLDAEALGPDYATAVARCELLNGQWDTWRLGRDDSVGTMPGTFKWLTAELYEDRRSCASTKLPNATIATV